MKDHEQAARVADRPDDGQTERRHLQDDEARFLGANACRTLWERRPQDIIRVYVRTDLQEAWKDLLDWCARERKAYHLVEDRDLEKLTDSVHHQGVCVVARRKEPIPFFRMEKDLRHGQAVSPLLLIDGVENPHNLGAILRTAGFLGVRYVIGRKESLPRLSPAALRTAEGGAEFCDLVESEDIVKDIEALKKLGYTVCSTNVKPGAISAFETRFDPRTVIILGAEVSGVTPEVQALADRTLHIPGSGSVESLNVAAAAAILCAEVMRQHGTPRTKLVRQGKT